MGQHLPGKTTIWVRNETRRRLGSLAEHERGYTMDEIINDILDRLEEIESVLESDEEDTDGE